MLAPLLRQEHATPFLWIMPSMDRDELRETFRAFAGERRFKRFVHALNARCKRRLFYWQHKLWDEFVAASPAAAMSFDQLKGSFNFCELHGCDLAKEKLALDVSKKDQYRALPQLPNAQVVIVLGLYGAPDEVIYCPECRRRADEWIQLPRAERTAELKKKILHS